MNFKKSLLVTSIVMATYGCSPQSVDDQMKEASLLIEKNDATTAIIKLKNTISDYPENPDSRLLLGSTYLELGLADSAKKELNMALDFGADMDLVIPQLANAMYLGQDYSDVLDLSVDELDEPQSRIQVLFFQAQSALKSGDGAGYGQLIELLEKHPEPSPYKIIASAQQYLLNSQFDLALLEINKLERNHNIPIAHLIKAEIFQNKQDYDSALDSMSTYSKMRPEDKIATINTAFIHLKNEDFEESEKVTDKLLKLLPNHSSLLYLKGLVKFEQKDYATAANLLNQASQVNPANEHATFYAAVASFYLGNYEQAYKALAKIESSFDDSHMGKKLLAITKLKLGYQDSISNELENIEVQSANDISLISTASYEYAKLGDMESAAKLLEKLNGKELNNEVNLVQQGLVGLALNRTDDIELIEKALAANPTNEQIKSVLIYSYISAELYDKALQQAQKWQENGDIDGYNLAGTVYAKLEDFKNAERVLVEALNIDPDNKNSYMFLAFKEFKNNEFDKSIEYLNKILEKEEGYIPALRLSFRANYAIGTTDRLTAKIDSLLKNNPENLNLAIVLAEMYLNLNKPKKVIDVLENINNDDIASEFYWLALADSYLATGQLKNALATLEKATVKQSKNKTLWIKRISFLENYVNVESALRTLKAARLHFNKDFSFKALEANYLIRTGEIAKAEQYIANNFTEKLRNSTSLAGIQGQLLLAKGKPAEAIPFLEAFYEQNNANFTARYVFTAYGLSEQPDKAILFLEQHIEQRPDDLKSLLILGNHYISRDLDRASEFYVSVLGYKPNNLLALNNLAWIYLQTNELSKADSLINHAVRLSPKSPNILDTAAVIKEAGGEIENAKALINEAYKLEPSNPSIVKNYQRISKL